MNTRRVSNPILPGFHPDPSALKVGDQFYVATSTFEWWPGITIHRSENLADWILAARPLDRVSQLDLRGVPASGGIWAPNLTWHDGLFWLVYTDVKNLYAPAKDLHNWLVTAPAIEGPWSEPVYLNASGFDPAFFHEDGRHWLINLNWDYRVGHNRFGGIVAQEYDPESRTLVGPITTLYPAKGLREGSNLYKKDGWYYLMVAEGGTGTEHAATMARSRSLLGPYEDDPVPLFLTSRFDPTHPLQKAGHASLVEDNGDWWLFHLAGRPIPSQGKYTLGRETCLQKVRWVDGWLRLADGGPLPARAVEVPDRPAGIPAVHERPAQGPHTDTFDTPELDPRFLSLRVPLEDDTLTLAERPGWLRLRGRESLSSRFHQALVARRWQSFRFTVTTVTDVAPEDFHHAAGLVGLYDHENWYYLARTFDETQGGPCLKVLAADNGVWTEEASTVVPQGPLALRMDVDWDRLRFWWAPAPEAGTPLLWNRLGRDFDASKLSDEHCREGWFTGAMVGLCCQDLSGRRRPADFDTFGYADREDAL